jgi:RNA polymerase sigma-70 factor, ECF subfamily
MPAHHPRAGAGDPLLEAPATESRGTSSARRKEARRDRGSLMEQIHEGNRTAMDDLIRRFWGPLVTYAREIVESPDDAEDVVQAVLLKVWERRTEWTPTDRLQAFLYRVTRNEALNHRRGARRARLRIARLAWMRRWAPTPDEILDRSTLAREVKAAVDSLPSRRREIFILARFHGRSHREIAEILDISPQTVANQMTAAVTQLRPALRRIYERYSPSP